MTEETYTIKVDELSTHDDGSRLVHGVVNKTWNGDKMISVRAKVVENIETWLALARRMAAGQDAIEHPFTIDQVVYVERNDW